MGKKWRMAETAYDPKNITLSVKHAGGSVMAWPYMAASGTGALVFLLDVTQDGVCGVQRHHTETEHVFTVI